MNELYIIGKVLGELDVRQSESGNAYGQLLVSIKRPFKNKDGNIDEDVIQIVIFKNGLDEAKDVVTNGKSVLIKGHINASNYSKDGKVIYSSSIIGDRISLLEDIC